MTQNVWDGGGRDRAGGDGRAARDYLNRCLVVFLGLLSTNYLWG